MNRFVKQSCVTVVWCHAVRVVSVVPVARNADMSTGLYEPTLMLRLNVTGNRSSRLFEVSPRVRELAGSF